MKQIPALLSLVIVVVSSASIGQAANTVWYTSGGSGGEGQVLNLECFSGGPPCSFSITMRVNGDDTVGLIAWASNLHASSSNTSITNVAIAPGNPFNSLAQAGTGGAGANLLIGSQGQTFGLPLTGAVSLITFTLNHPVTPGIPEISLITETAGDGATGVVWAGGDGDYAVVSFAGGPPLPHPESSPGGPVIRLEVNVPEPATVGLLVVGALIQFRRGRLR